MSQGLQDLTAVLVIGPNWVGDAVMSTPVLTNLRRALPKAKIDLLLPPRLRPLFEEHPHVDRLLIHDHRQAWRKRAAHIRGLRRAGYDVALVLPNSFRAALWGWMSGAARRVGYATDGRRWLLTHAIPAGTVQPIRRHRGTAVNKGSERPPHQIAAYLRLVEALGIPAIERRPLLVPSANAEAAAERVWTAAGLARHERVVGLCPGAAFGPAKRWRPERFAALGDRLIREGGRRVVLFGSPEEVPLVEHICSLMSQHAVGLAGQDTLSSFMALAARCEVLVTNDSGAMHIATAVGTPVVAIFGPTDPYRTAPTAPRATFLRRDLPCSPCFRTVCPYSDHPCMRLIEVDEVYKAVLHLVGMGLP